MSIIRKIKRNQIKKYKKDNKINKKDFVRNQWRALQNKKMEEE